MKYCRFLCCGSMSMTVTLDEMGYEKLAHAIVLIFWVGVGFGALAFVKVKANKVRSFRDPSLKLLTFSRAHYVANDYHR